MALNSHIPKAPWLRTKPTDWRADRLKDIVPRILGGGTPSSSDPDCWEAGDIIWVTPTDFSRDGSSAEIRDSERKITQVGLNSSAATLLPKNTVIMASRATIGAVRIADTELTTNQGFISFVTNDNVIHHRFLFYVIAGFLGEYFADIAPGTTFSEISRGEAKLEPIAFPPLPEQQRIVAYLDASCAAIDVAVAAKRRQLETLDDLHKSITLQVVTKGLDPNVPMRETGIDWIPQIPAHWETTKLTSLFWFRKGARAGEITQKYIAEYPGEFPVFSGQTEDGGLMGSIDSFEFDFDSPVIFVTTVGAKAMTTRLVRGKFSVSQNCALIIPWHRKTRVDYFEPTIQELFDFERRSIALIMQPSLRFKDLKKFRLPLPPPTEQTAICAHLDAKLGEANRIASGIETQITTLVAFRKSLIHECVTGQRRIKERDLNHVKAHG